VKLQFWPLNLPVGESTRVSSVGTVMDEYSALREGGTRAMGCFGLIEGEVARYIALSSRCYAKCEGGYCTVHVGAQRYQYVREGRRQKLQTVRRMLYSTRYYRYCHCG
jgi:hypothetical protein